MLAEMDLPRYFPISLFYNIVAINQVITPNENTKVKIFILVNTILILFFPFIELTALKAIVEK